MKKALCFVIASVMTFVTLCACSEKAENAEKPEMTGHKLTVYNDFTEEKVTATFLNSATGESEEITAESIDDEKAEGGKYEFYCDSDKYDKVYFTYNDDTTDEVAFNDYVTGWLISSLGVFPLSDEEYPDEDSFSVDYEIQTFDYGETTKNIYIWTPDNYEKNSDEKYAVVYMTDGQNLFDRWSTSHGCWNVAQSAVSAMHLSDAKLIIVGIDDSSGNRDSELTPNLGESTDEGFNDGTGAYFSDFVYKTVVPYIEENYNVYTDAAHNAVCGSSSGGIESFYIGMEHPDKFGTIGALSPAFMLFTDEAWREYLASKSFEDGYPFVYIYNGDKDDLESMLLVSAESMTENLKAINYPEDKIYTYIYKDGMHNEEYWRQVFPDFLKYMLDR